MIIDVSLPSDTPTISAVGNLVVNQSDAHVWPHEAIALRLAHPGSPTPCSDLSQRPKLPHGDGHLHSFFPTLAIR